MEIERDVMAHYYYHHTAVYVVNGAAHTICKIVRNHRRVRVRKKNI